MKLSRAQLEEVNNRLQAQNNLLELYLYDTVNNVEPTSVVNIVKTKDCSRVSADLYRATGAMGGYVILKYHMPGQKIQVHIATLDTFAEQFSRDYSQYSVNARIVIERLRIERQKLSNLTD